MDIYLIRHTTPDVAKGICYGQADIDVTDSFLDEVTKIHTTIPPSTAIDYIYSSPLIRCKKLAQTFNKEVHEDMRLMELNFGNWELQAWDAIDKKESTPWMEDFVYQTVPNGESYIDLQQRVLNFYHEIISLKADTIIIVTHAGPIRALLATLQSIPLKDSFSINVVYGQISKISISAQKAIITASYSI